MISRDQLLLLTCMASDPHPCQLHSKPNQKPRAPDVDGERRALRLECRVQVLTRPGQIRPPLRRVAPLHAERWPRQAAARNVVRARPDVGFHPVFFRLSSNAERRPGDGEGDVLVLARAGHVVSRALALRSSREAERGAAAAQDVMSAVVAGACGLPERWGKVTVEKGCCFKLPSVRRTCCTVQCADHIELPVHHHDSCRFMNHAMQAMQAIKRDCRRRDVLATQRFCSYPIRHHQTATHLAAPPSPRKRSSFWAVS